MATMNLAVFRNAWISKIWNFVIFCDFACFFSIPRARHGYDSFFFIRFSSVSESFDPVSTHDSQWFSKN